MSITPAARCTVPTGIIFNVDAHHHPECEKDGGGALAVHKDWRKLAPPNAANHFKTIGVGSDEGWIRVYVEINRPTPAPVV
jgi:hypothetical protein